MKERDNTQQNRDPNLDIPSEANTDKHINFLDVESNEQNSGNNRVDRETQERREQWQQGLQEGKEQMKDRD